MYKPGRLVKNDFNSACGIVFIRSVSTLGFGKAGLELLLASLSGPRSSVLSSP